MAKSKYDWSELKHEFMTSECDEVKAFFQHKYGIYNRHISNNTAGRTEEKKANKAAIEKESAERAKVIAIEKRANQKAKIHEAVFDIVDLLIKDVVAAKEGKKKLGASSLQQLLGILKTEIGEASTISKSINNNTNTDTKEIERSEQDAIDNLLENL